MTGCPLYILTVDRLPFDEFDAEKASYIEEWKQLGEELGADKFILKDNEALEKLEPILKDLQVKQDTSKQDAINERNGLNLTNEIKP